MTGQTDGSAIAHTAPTYSVIQKTDCTPPLVIKCKYILAHKFAVGLRSKFVIESSLEIYVSLHCLVNFYYVAHSGAT